MIVFNKKIEKDLLAKAQGELKDNDEEDSDNSESDEEDDSSNYDDIDNDDDEERFESTSMAEDDLGFVQTKPEADSSEDMEETKDVKKSRNDEKANNSDYDNYDEMVSLKNKLIGVQFDINVTLDQLNIPSKKIDHNENFCASLRSLGERSPEYINQVIASFSDE